LNWLLFLPLIKYNSPTKKWYDFAVFGFLSDVIGDVFFPPQRGDEAITESFVVFGGAFLMRPIGGIVMGYVGDKYGRKKALVISILMMAFPTFIMGCLPSYERAGFISIVLLIIVRLMQGFSVGGQASFRIYRDIICLF
jgi:MHS family proline/betaine transporter-like MFS transporter